MSESLTGEPVTQPASVPEPTGNEVIVPAPAESNQETISGEQSQEAVSTTTPTNNQPEGAVNTDDSLAKFAKSQGINEEEYSSLSDREKKLLKIASDNQKAFRSQDSPKLTDVSTSLSEVKPDATDEEKFRGEFNQFRYEQKTSQFWAGDGRDKTLEPIMVEILNEKKAVDKNYAKALSNDLDTLYDLAQARSGKSSGSSANEEAIRREERESINQRSNAGAPAAHASSSAPTSSKIDLAWVQNEYDSNNAEHVKLLDEAVARGDLY